MALSEEATLVVRMTAQDLTGPTMDQLETRTGRLSKAAAAAGGILTGVLASAVVGALADAARAGAEHEASLARLVTAVNNTTAGYSANALALGAASRMARDYGFTTIEVNDALALLVEQTGSADAAIARIIVAENLARGAHIDLYTASMLLGKATDENTNVLARYGIVIEEGADVTAMLAAVQAKFGGQAVAYGATTAGAIDRTAHAMDDWRASVGNSFGPLQAYLALLPGVTNQLLLAGGAAGAVGDALYALTGVTLAAAAPVLAVTAAVSLAGFALYEIGLTVKEVTDHWDLFIHALRNSELNDIPVFGFFFSKAQSVLGFIDNIRGAWSAIASAVAGGVTAGEHMPAYASGTSFVPRTGLALLHQGEAIVPAEQNRRGWRINVNLSSNVTQSEQHLGEVIGKHVMHVLTSSRPLAA